MNTVYLVRDRKSGTIYGIFKDYALAKGYKGKLMATGINAGVDQVQTDLF